MAEISSLLGLITDDNTRQALIAQMENMFDNAPDEERLIQEIGNPTKVAVALIRYADSGKITPAAAPVVAPEQVQPRRTPQPRPWFDDGKSAWVEVGVTINGMEAKETYAIMDFKNNAVKAEQVTSTDANKAKMRALAKACAQWGLGLYIYEGEDMPEGVKKERTGLADARKKVVSAAQAAVKKGVDRAKIYALIAEKNNGNDSPTEIPTITLCNEITTAIKAVNDP